MRETPALLAQQAQVPALLVQQAWVLMLARGNPSRSRHFMKPCQAMRVHKLARGNS